jgi:hypothetical protein
MTEPARYTQYETVYFTPEGRHKSLSIGLTDSNDSGLWKAMITPAYDEDFVGPQQPVMRGELGELSGIRIIDFPYVPPVKSKTLKAPPRSKGPKKHWRRW